MSEPDVLPSRRAVLAAPQFWWRGATLLASVAGVLAGSSHLVYFTIQSNLFVIGYFAAGLYWMLVRRTRSMPAPRLRGAVTLWILVTALIAHFMLGHGASPLPGLVHPDPSERLAAVSLFLLHYVGPAMVVLDWVAFGPRGRVRWRDLPLWLLYPVGYGLVMLGRGVLLPVAPDRYPYPFLDPQPQGYGWVWLQLLEIAVIIAVLGAAVIGIDRLAGLVGRLVRGEAREADGAARLAPARGVQAASSASESRIV